MMLTTPDEDLRAQVLSAIEIVDEHHRSSSGWNEKYGHAFAFLFQILEKDLKEWIRANPPGHADYDKSTPERDVRETSQGLRASSRLPNPHVSTRQKLAMMR
jgi:hypothetical protein